MIGKGSLRVMFESAIVRMNEKKSNLNFFGIIYKFMKTTNKSGNKTQTESNGLRYGISGDSKETLEFITGVILDKVKSRSYNIDVAKPDRVKKGNSRSGTYYTYKITALEDFEYKVKSDKVLVEKGSTVYFVDNLKAKSNIQNKMLTPDGLGLSGKSYDSIGSVIADVTSGLNDMYTSEVIGLPHKSLMESLMKDLGSISTGFNSILDISEGDSDTIQFKTDIIENISDSDIAKIGKDFGEILGGIYMLQKVKRGESGLKFPERANEPLVDFYIEGQGLSMKSASGAAASLSNIGNLIAGLSSTEYDEISANENEKLLLNIIEKYSTLSAYEGTVKVALTLKDVNPGWSLYSSMLNYIGITEPLTIKHEEITTALRNSFKNNPKETYSKLTEYFYNMPNYGTPKGWSDEKLAIEDGLAREQGYGVIHSPLNYSNIAALNSNTILLDALNSVVQKFDILQLYIDLSINRKKKFQKYTLKKFAAGRFKFATSSSINKPIQNKVSFKMIK